jgi:L-glutamine:2-deoxy-scyllo-inosose/3-amino-2,3-dideoxy-scyllo-inosose aminotransferase
MHAPCIRRVLSRQFTIFREGLSSPSPEETLAQLALLGGSPVCDAFVKDSRLVSRKDLERQYLLEAYDSGVWDDWPDVDSMASRFETEWAAFCGSNHCALISNGTHTLQVGLETLDIGFGDEVIVPGLTWQATASVVCDVNATPILVDVDPDTLCIDPRAVERAITPNTRAIIPVHLYHRMADMDAIREIAERHNLAVIEDCAHAHGSRWGNAGAGTMGAFGSFSFQRSKLMNCGEGGALLMQDEEDYWKVVSQRSCGREFRDGIKIHSGNYRMTSLQAAILRGQLAAHAVNCDIIDGMGRELDAAVDAAPGVRSLTRHPQLTRQCSYGFLFLFEPEAWDGLDVNTFRRALGAELGFEFWNCYAPLHRSEVYYPHTKRRHHLSESYVEAIDPSRWSLPVTDHAREHQVVLAHWPIFGCSGDRPAVLTDAIAKLQSNRNELIAVSEDQYV